MRWITDGTGRFPRRPYYLKEELDGRCEARVQRFLQERYGVVRYPLSTDDLMVLIEEEVEDLDVCADLSALDHDGRVVEGVTTFVVGRRPQVRVSEILVAEAWREPRLRTTLAHEYGHVLFHSFIGQPEAPRQLPLFDAASAGPASQHCAGTPLLHAGQTDWMEWQAGYACGALLMPRTAMHEATHWFIKEAGGPIALWSPDARRLVASVHRQFQVSEAAARVRLQQLGYLTTTPPTPSLFDRR